MTSKSIRFRLLVVWAVALACLLTTGAWATTYYVAPNGVDDIAGGSKTAPWATINFGDANSLLQPGDTVIVTEGTYVQNTATLATFKMCSGTPEAPITYIAQGHVVIDGAASSTACLCIGNNSIGVDYLVFDGFDIKGGKRSIDIKGPSLDPCMGIVIRNCLLHDCTGGYMMQNTQMGDCKIYNNTFYITDGLAGAFTNRAISTATTLYGNKIWNNTFYIGGGTASPRGGIFFTAPSAWADPGKMGTDEIKNNIIWEKDYGAAGVFALWTFCTTPIDPNPGWYGLPIVDTNNLYWPAGLRFTWIFKYPDPANVGIWQDCSLYDSIGVYPDAGGYWDPMFTNVASANFTPQAGSWAIDHGTDVGLPFFGSAPDMGAIETLPAGAVVTDKLANATSQVDGTAVDISNCVVTVSSGVFSDDVIYVEDAARTAGIAVKSSPLLPKLAEGQHVEVAGTLGTTSAGQRILNAVTIKLVAGDTPLKPLGMNGKSITDFGPDKQGMLVTVWGKVSASVSGMYFCAFDGAGSADGDGMGNEGIAIYVADMITPLIDLPTTSAKYVAVTGVVGKSDGFGVPKMVIRPRSADDIQVID